MLSPPYRLSIVVPVFNEAATLGKLVQDLQHALHQHPVEIIIVDDCSTDGSAEIIRNIQAPNVRAFFHSTNQGKGACLRTALRHASGDIVVIQDADLEYDPKDIPRLIQPIADGQADVVFGSRFHNSQEPAQAFWHRAANRWLTFFSNRLTGLNLADMETGYKAFRKDVLDRVHIRENGFGVEPELTAKVAKLNCRVCEVPISYNGRDYAQGKKIGVLDAIWAMWCVIRYRFAD
jgi:glycosyltransferase involved in cell wall biosynthesis